MDGSIDLGVEQNWPVLGHAIGHHWPGPFVARVRELFGRRSVERHNHAVMLVTFGDRTNETRVICHSGAVHRHFGQQLGWVGAACGVLVVVSCSADTPAADGCERLTQIVVGIDDINHASQLPTPTELRLSLDEVLLNADEMRSDASLSTTVRAALDELRINALEYQRSVEPYGYDLLVTQTAASSDEQQRLYSFESATSLDAQAQLRQHIADECAAAPAG